MLFDLNVPIKVDSSNLEDERYVGLLLLLLKGDRLKLDKWISVLEFIEALYQFLHRDRTNPVQYLPCEYKNKQ